MTYKETKEKITGLRDLGIRLTVTVALCFLFIYTLVTTAEASSVPELSLSGGTSVTTSIALSEAGEGIAPGATVSSFNSWSGGRLTIERVTLAGNTDLCANDVFGFVSGNGLTTSGAAPTKGNRSNGTLKYNNTQFATWSYIASGKLVITFGSNATTDMVQLAVRSISYRNATPYGNALIRFQLSDATASVAANATVTDSTIYVDQTDYDTDGDAADGFNLAEALAKAVDGDTVLIQDGVYRGQFVVTTAVTIDAVQGENGDVTLESPDEQDLVKSDQDMLTNNGRWRVPILDLKTSVKAQGTVTVRNLKIDGRYQAINDEYNGNKDMLGIGVFDTNAVIEHVDIQHIAVPFDATTGDYSGFSENYGILCEGSIDAPAIVNVKIVHSTIGTFQKTGIIAWGPKLHVDILDNEITAVGVHGVSNQNGIQIGSAGARTGTTAKISGNIINNLDTYDTYWNATGIIMRECGDVEIMHNTMKVEDETRPATTNGALGICTLDIMSTSSISIHDNTFVNLAAGVSLENRYNNASGSSFRIENNEFSTCQYAVEDSGSYYGFTNTAEIIQNSTIPVANGLEKLLYYLCMGDDNYTDNGSVASKINGYAGNDNITAGSGDDILIGGVGDDTLTGGDGNDNFLYYLEYPSLSDGSTNDPSLDSGCDTITDFGKGDTITVTGVTLTGSITEGDGSVVAAHSLQVSEYSNGITTLYLDTDATEDAPELKIQLLGEYHTDNFKMSGDTISFIPRLNTPSGLGWNSTTKGMAYWGAVNNAQGYIVQLKVNGVVTGSAIALDSQTLEYDYRNSIKEGGNGSYTFSVTAVGNGTDYCNSPSSTVSDAYVYITALNAPTGLAWDSVNQGIVLWSPVSQASGYRIQLVKNGNPVGSPISTVSGSAISVTGGAISVTGGAISVTGGAIGIDLSTNIAASGTGSYTCQVVAVGDGVNYIDSTPAITSSAYHYVSPAVPLNPPEGLIWDSLVPGLAQWNNVPNASGYSLQLYKDGTAIGSPVSTVSGSAISISYDFTAAIIAGGTGNYTYTVTAIGDGVIYSGSNAAIVTTAYNYTAPAIVLDSPSGLNWSSAVQGKATWNAVSNASGYRVQLLKDGDVVSTVIVNAPAIEYAFASSMEANGSGIYTFHVTALGDGSIYSNSSAAVVVSGYQYTTPAIALDSPSGLNWSNSVQGKATWNSVSHANGYTVKLLKNGNVVSTVTVNTTTTEYAFASSMALYGSGTYTFNVVALGDGSIYSNSSTVTVETGYHYTAPAIVLDSPDGLNWSSAVQGKATWNTVSHASGYTVKLLKNGNVVSTVNVNTATTEYAFAASMALYGSGTYTFNVVALGDGMVYNNSPVAVASGYSYTAAGATGGTTGGTSGGTAQTPASGAVRTVEVAVGNDTTSTAAAKVDIVRTTENNKQVDTVVLNDTKTTQALAAASDQKTEKVTLTVTDLADNQADKVVINVANTAVKKMMDANVALEIQTEEVSIELPKDTVQALSEKDNDLYFRVVPVRDTQERSKAVENAITAKLVLDQAGNSDVTALGTPMTIETNYQNLNTKVTFSLKNINVPTDAAQRKNFLDSLGIYIVHSDGSEEFNQGVIKYDENGNPVGIVIEINKFSTFTIVSINKKVPEAEVKDAANKAPKATEAVITGKLVEGSTLTASYSYQDKEKNKEGSSRYQWYRADNKAGKNKKIIKGATALFYTLTKRDAGHYMIFEVVPVAKAGTKKGKPVIAVTSTVVKAAEPVYKQHVKLGLIGNESYANRVAKLFMNYNQAGNVKVIKEGNYYRVSIDFVNKAAAEAACKDMKNRQLIINYYYITK